MKLISFLIFFMSFSSFAGDKKCLKRKDLKGIYGSQKMKYVSNYGHVLAIKSGQFKQGTGYNMDVYALKKIGVKNQKTKKISHYNKCLTLVKKNMQGTYIYGSFSRSGVQIRSNNKVKRVSFVGR